MTELELASEIPQAFLRISEARAALALANTIDEVRRVRQWAAATRDVMRRHRRVYGARVEAEDAELDASELCIDAVRSEGDMLLTMRRNDERAARGQRKQMRV